MATIWYDSLVSWCNEFAIWTEDPDWSIIPISPFVANFLLHGNKLHVVDFICASVLDQAQYILADPDFLPEDLLQLPRPSKEDFNWGCYFDLFTQSSNGLVIGWYAGSATGYGYQKRPGGLIGRILLYFPATLQPTFSHERWLAGTLFPGSHPNFRKVADCGSRPQYHRIYTLIMEA